LLRCTDFTRLHLLASSYQRFCANFLRLSKFQSHVKLIFFIHFFTHFKAV